MTDEPKLRHAASLIVFRRAADEAPPQLLMAERTAKMRFAGGASVFPGGQVDAADHALAAQLAGEYGSSISIEDAAARIAAIRETLEETGLATAMAGPQGAAEIAEARSELSETGDFAAMLMRRSWRLQLDALIPFARWLPRGLGHSHIFDTRFYLTDIGAADPALSPDSHESSRLFWLSADAALAAANNEEIRVIFPTRRNLERLAQFPDFAAARRHAEHTPIQTITPWIEAHEGEQWLTIPDDAGYPVHRQRLAEVMRG